MQPPVPTSKPVGKPTTIYHVDPLTNELTGSAIADLDPIEQKALIPAYATAISPPKKVKGKVAVFDAVLDAWSQSPDNRGVVYDTTTGTEEVYTAIGKLPKQLTKAKPFPHSTYDPAKKAWVLDITKLKAIKLSEIKTAYDALIASPVTALGASFDANDVSKARIDRVIGRLTSGWKPPVGQDVWLDVKNQPHPMTLVNMNAIADAIATRDAAAFFRLQTAKAATNTASTAKSITTIKF